MTGPDITAALQAAADLGRLAAKADRAAGTRTGPPSSVSSDSPTERRLAVAWWAGYEEVWPAVAQELPPPDLTGTTGAERAQDAERVTDEDLHWNLPNR